MADRTGSRTKWDGRLPLLTPMIPNFIRTESGHPIPIQDLDDKTLRAIARNWTALLLLAARNKRRKARG